MGPSPASGIGGCSGQQRSRNGINIVQALIHQRTQPSASRVPGRIQRNPAKHCPSAAEQRSDNANGKALHAGGYESPASLLPSGS